MFRVRVDKSAIYAVQRAIFIKLCPHHCDTLVARISYQRKLRSSLVSHFRHLFGRAAHTLHALSTTTLQKAALSAPTKLSDQISACTTCPPVRASSTCHFNLFVTRLYLFVSAIIACKRYLGWWRILYVKFSHWKTLIRARNVTDNKVHRRYVTNIKTVRRARA